MRLLVTRPALDQQQTCDALQAMGIEALSAPVMEAQRLSFTLPDEVWQAVVITSRNGLRALKETELTHLQDKPLFCVGEKTERLARELGFSNHRLTAPDMASLAPPLLAALDPAKGPLLYLTAKHRSGDLTEQLAAHGQAFALIEAYEMVAASCLPDEVISAICENQLDGVLLYSLRSCHLFLMLADAKGLGDALAGLTFYCLSPAIATSVEEAGYPLVVADTPNEDSLLACVKKGRNYSTKGVSDEV